MKITDLRDPPELADLIARAIKLHRDMSEEERDHMREMQRRSLIASARKAIAEGCTL